MKVRNQIKYAILVSILGLLFAQAASAITFSQADLNAFTVQDATVNGSADTYTIGGVNSPANAVVVSPTYSDNTPDMCGAAGATGRWDDSLFGDDVAVYFGLDSAGVLAQFGNNDLSGETTLEIIAFNDNDDIWGHDVWIETTANGRVESTPADINGATSGPPNFALLTLDISGLDLSDVIGIGVSVHGQLDGGNFPSSGDSFHSSWSPVPEPGSLLLLGTGLLALGFVARRKKSGNAA